MRYPLDGWVAVREVYPRVAKTFPKKAEFRVPDAIAGGTWEALERIFQDADCFAGGLRKVELASLVAPHMVAARNTSESFGAFAKLLAELQPRAL